MTIQTIVDETPQQQADIRTHKDIAAFSYIWIMAIFIFLFRKDSPFVRYHSRQALVLFILSIPILFIPVVGRLLIFLIVALEMYGFYLAANGQKKDLPFIGALAKGNASVSGMMTEARELWKQVLLLIHTVKRKMQPDQKSTTDKPQKEDALKTFDS